MIAPAIISPLGEPIYTLAQSGTAEPVTVHGRGSEKFEDQDLIKMAKKKKITQKMVLNLVDIAKRKNEPHLIQPLWNTYHCQNQLYSSGRRFFGKYCKNRFCTTCLGIRKAELINKYLPIINTWEDPQFVTLTVKAQPAKRLSKVIDAMIRGFKRINDKHKKRDQRSKGEKLIGARSLECNFNPNKRTYNPHFHIIVPNQEMANTILEDWLSLWGKKWTNRYAQHIKPVDDNEVALIEIIKYGTKIFTEPDLKSKSKGASEKVYVAAMYNIFSAMHGHRLFDRFGFNLPKQDQQDAKTYTLVNYDEWEYLPKLGDWFSVFSGEALTNHQLNAKLMNLLRNNIDVQLE